MECPQCALPMKLKLRSEEAEIWHCPSCEHMLAQWGVDLLHKISQWSMNMHWVREGSYNE